MLTPDSQQEAGRRGRESLPHLCSDRRAAGLRVPLHDAVVHNVGQWPCKHPALSGRTSGAARV